MMNTNTTATTPPPPTATASSLDIIDIVQWNPTQVCLDLQIANTILNDRCLHQAAKFVTEQWTGLPVDVILSCRDDAVNSSIPSHLHVTMERNPAVALARNVMETGDYAYCAALLSDTVKPMTTVETMQPPPPTSDVSPKAIYFRAYGWYLAGEQAKFTEQELLDSQGQPTGSAKNPYLSQLKEEFVSYHQDGMLDPFGLYVYGVVLKELQDYSTAQSVLIESILAFPYNWSAWLELAHVENAADEAASSKSNNNNMFHMSSTSAIPASTERRLTPLHGHFMYHFYCGYAMAERQQHADAMVVYERWMDTSLFGGSPYLLTQFAISAYSVRDFEKAAQLFHDLHEHMPYRLDQMDIYSNILFVQNESVALCQLAHTAATVSPLRPESCIILGNYYSHKQDRPRAIAAFRRAVEVDPTHAAAYTLMGHEYMEGKQTTHALAAYRRAVQCSSRDYRAWYGLGQAYELLHLYVYAVYYYQKAVALRPYDPRMWSALGVVLLALEQPDAAVLALRRAADEPVAVQKLAGLYRDRGDTESAAAWYMKHLELRNPNKNATAVSSGDMLRLEHLLQSILIESTEASAILYLAGYHRDRDEFDIATTFAQCLLDYAGPEKEHAKAMLREIQSRRGHGMVTRSKAASTTTTTSSFEFTP